MNEDFIEGKQTQQRSAKISNDDAKSHRSKSNKGKGVKKQKNKSSAGDEENEDDDDKSQKSRKADEETAKMINKQLKKLRFEIPDTCKLELNKNVQVEKLEAKYLLVMHPYPMFEGEMLIIQPKKDDQVDKTKIILRDYSLRKRMINSGKEEDKKKKDKEKTKL